MKKTYVDGYLIDTNPSDKGGFTIAIEDKIKTYEIKQKNLTNNQVEIMACIVGMLEKPKIIISDSQIAVKCINGEWKGKNEKLLPLINLGRVMLKIKKKTLIWEKRDNNLAGIYNDQHFEQHTGYQTILKSFLKT